MLYFVSKTGETYDCFTEKSFNVEWGFTIEDIIEHWSDIKFSSHCKLSLDEKNEVREKTWQNLFW